MHREVYCEYGHCLRIGSPIFGFLGVGEDSFLFTKNQQSVIHILEFLSKRSTRLHQTYYIRHFPWRTFLLFRKPLNCVHWLNQQTFIEHLLYVIPSAGCWGLRRGANIGYLKAKRGVYPLLRNECTVTTNLPGASRCTPVQWKSAR